MRPRFREDKTTQAAALLLKRAGGTMNRMKLIKLLYLADRKALVRGGRPISFGRPLSMRHGPVLSEILDLINEGSPPGAPSFWTRTIASPANHEVRLNAECPPEDLSDAQEEVLAEVCREYGRFAPWPLVDTLHQTLPEWTPTDGAVPIRCRDILLSEGWTETEVADFEADLDELALADRLLPARRSTPDAPSRSRTVREAFHTSGSW